MNPQGLIYFLRNVNREKFKLKQIEKSDVQKGEDGEEDFQAVGII